MEKSPLLQQLASMMWQRHYAKRTIESYLYWISSYIRFHSYNHPCELSNRDVESFLTELAVNQKVSVSTQALALNALNFLYKEFLQQPLDLQLNFVRSKLSKKLPEVLTVSEVSGLLSNVGHETHLPVSLLYGSGLRLMECVRLRTGDVDFDYKTLRVSHLN